MALHIAVCNNRKDGALLREMLAASGALRSVDYQVDLLESSPALLSAARDEPGHFDIVLLSTTITGKSTLDPARELRRWEPDCPLILTAQSSELAAEGYGVFAAGFLTRPYSQALLDRFLSRAVADCGRRQKRQLFYVKVRQEYVPVSEADLIYAESNLKYLNLHLVDGTVLRTMMTLASLKKLLCGQQFLITHKSFLINMDFVTKVEPCEFTLGSYGTASITQRRYPQIRNEYFDYIARRDERVTETVRETARSF